MAGAHRTPAAAADGAVGRGDRPTGRRDPDVGERRLNPDTDEPIEVAPPIRPGWIWGADSWHRSSARCRIWTANIRFRDHLRTEPDAAARYALAKQQAAEATGMLTAYSELKAAIVAELMDEAGQ
ncbi:GrpB family protein [Catenulispora sp. NF23]|uniref:GrpB family protein n=1 Tax=Catenulispora pinistramenti TaxID=2705254 RepID=UPI001BA6204C|nr:GrpB family protein [Catenulispora pinistramenti]MBS2538840.1 GrpB family protein [Catenulispora pinistramenti]